MDENLPEMMKLCFINMTVGDSISSNILFEKTYGLKSKADQIIDYVDYNQLFES